MSISYGLQTKQANICKHEHLGKKIMERDYVRLIKGLANSITNKKEKRMEECLSKFMSEKMLMCKIVPFSTVLCKVLLFLSAIIINQHHKEHSV